MAELTFFVGMTQKQYKVYEVKISVNVIANNKEEVMKYLNKHTYVLTEPDAIRSIKHTSYTVDEPDNSA